MSAIHCDLDVHFCGADWVSILAGPDLPTPAAHTTAGAGAGAVHPLEAAMVDEMNAEVRTVLASAPFQCALVHAVKYAAKEAAEGMVAKFAAVRGSKGAAGVVVGGEAGGKLQFPKVVGIVAASCEAMFDPLGRIRKVGGWVSWRAGAHLACSLFGVCSFPAALPWSAGYQAALDAGHTGVAV